MQYIDKIINKIKELNIKNDSNKCNNCKNNCVFLDKRNMKIYKGLPNTDKIIINLHDDNIDIELIYKIIDDITTYMSGEIELPQKGFSVLYDDNGGFPDRYQCFF